MIRRYWPELVVLCFGLWFGAIFGLTDDRIFAHRLTGDSVLSPYFYDHVSRALLGETGFEWLSSFNYPEPKHHTIEFPNVADAVFFSPLHWIFDWPQQWNATFQAYLLLNGLSMALLARVLGLGPYGIVMAGLCGLWMRGPYVDMAKGRIQTVGIAFFVTAMACTLGILSRDLNGNERSQSIRRIFWVGCILTSSLGALIYPPFLLLLLPFGGVLWFAHRPTKSENIWLVAAVGIVSTLTAWPLYRMAQIRQFHGQELQCPTDYNRMEPFNLGIMSAELSQHGIPLVLWMGLPLWLCWREKPKLWLTIFCLSGMYLALSLGPCIGSETPSSVVSSIHIWFMWIQDWGRLATVSGIGLSLIVAASVSGLMVRSTAWGTSGIVVALGLFLPLLKDIQRPTYWHIIPESFVQKHLRDLDSQTVVVFPFESSETIMDALALPKHRMVNPLRSQDPPRPDHSTALRWMFELGKGDPNPTTPAKKSLAWLNIDWVIYDPSRCLTPYRYQEACAAHVQNSLRAELGEGVAAENGVVFWKLKN
ncbi:MAG: hypothetical protein VXZ96_08230 [Myxococcota bacterium]|nr:hypothetical protein [Myxococcota bacterium]